jgi:hypothetical protein
MIVETAGIEDDHALPVNGLQIFHPKLLKSPDFMYDGFRNMLDARVRLPDEPDLLTAFITPCGIVPVAIWFRVSQSINLSACVVHEIGC